MVEFKFHFNISTCMCLLLVVVFVKEVSSAPLELNYRNIEDVYEDPDSLSSDTDIFQSNNIEDFSDVLRIVEPKTESSSAPTSKLVDRTDFSTDNSTNSSNSTLDHFTPNSFIPDNLIGQPVIQNTFNAEQPQRVVNETQVRNTPDVMKFLKKFGYLEEGLPNSEALYQEEAISDAISTMQRFGGLNPTGKMDNETLELLVSPRCGNKDIDAPKPFSRQKRYVIGSPGWNKRTITYFLANWSPKVGSEEIAKRELEKAFQLWSGYAHLKFVPKSTPDADIIIYFGRYHHGDNYPFDGPGYTLAHAYYPYEFGSFGGDIHFDDDENWSVGPKDDNSGIDFFTVAAHELGHSLGLSHSPVPGSIMFPYYKGYQQNLQLDYDDILAMYQLYISRPIQDDSYTSTSDDTATTTTSTTTTTTTTTTMRPTTARTRTTTPSSGRKDDDDDEYADEDNVTINYNGDYETVDEHRGRYNRTTPAPTSPPTTTTTTTPAPPKIPDICNTTLDAISVLRNELFAFKDGYVWRTQNRGPVHPSYPVPFRYIFGELPSHVKKVDAVYERPNGNIVFFSGPRYWVFNGDRMVEENQPLRNLGLPEGLDRVDAALVWGKNAKTYIFSKNLYWRYDDSKRKMDPGYPHDISRWRGVPGNLDAAMKWTDGKSYFFKNTLFWRFDDAIIKVDDRYPLPFPQYWFGCPEKEDNIW